MTRKGRMFREGGKTKGSCRLVTESGSREELTRPVCIRGAGLYQVQCSGGELELPDTRTGSSTEERRELCLR